METEKNEKLIDGLEQFEEPDDAQTRREKIKRFGKEVYDKYKWEISRVGSKAFIKYYGSGKIKT